MMAQANSFTPIWANPAILSAGQYAAIGLSIALSLILPLALMIIFVRKAGFRPVGIGALCFFVMQMLLRAPLLQVFQAANQQWLQALAPTSTGYHLYLLALSLTAGLVEEWGRYGFMLLLLKGRRSALDAIAFGTGHGGIEAILIVGINLLAQLLLTPQVYINSAPYLLTLGGFERVFAMCFHIAMSVLVMRRGLSRPRFVWLAVLLHTLFNYVPIALAPLMGLSAAIEPLAAEALLMLFAAAAVWYVFRELRAKTEIPAQ